jgi:hypothetical protein
MVICAGTVCGIDVAVAVAAASRQVYSDMTGACD